MLEYELLYKEVKRMNLRVRSNGTVMLSVPYGTDAKNANAFVAKNVNWIIRAQNRISAPVEDLYSNEDCLATFKPVFDRYYPLVAWGAPVKPLLKVRFMKSCWGVCHIQTNYITLNKQLMDKPKEALEYVILHELVHLLHPNHQDAFHREMAKLMPDYRQRKALLKLNSTK